jgi:aspartyl-tRNA(Asn)/glutamyl-tRNA(Gln) amidotransferase subunit A
MSQPVPVPTQLVQDFGRVRSLSGQIAAGRITSADLVERALARVALVDGAVRAWLLPLAEEARAAARALDAEARAGHSRGPLHGIPVAVKDVIDVAGAPTRANCRARAALPPASADATVVAHLRAAGAVILGKVHTTELAYMESVPPTRNPHDLTRTPGGSSAGSAAAIASGTVPLALGTQTAGSVNRPAAYCGIGAFKPSTLAIGGAGVVPLAPSFDTVGAFGATAAEAALLASGYAAAHLRLGQGAAGGGRVIVLTDPLLDRADAETRAAVAGLADALAASGLAVDHAAAPVALEDLRTEHRIVMLAELAGSQGGLPANLVSVRLATDIAAGLGIPPAEYHRALAALAGLRARFWAAFGPADLLLVPAAPAVAPVGTATGDPAFIAPFTALGGPIATVRAGLGAASKMPVGALLATAPGTDARLAAFLLDQADPALDL